MSETATIDAPATEPTARQMRAYLRSQRPDLGVGLRGFLSKDAKNVYRQAHNLPTED